VSNAKLANATILMMLLTLCWLDPVRIQKPANMLSPTMAVRNMHIHFVIPHKSVKIVRVL